MLDWRVKCDAGALAFKDDITNDEPGLIPQFEEKIGRMYSTLKERSNPINIVS